jgi:methylated-DNA-protein-cysteine methyltransferase-like protein
MSYQNPIPDVFNPLVWDIVRQIPKGRVATYGQIASMIPAPDGVPDADYDRLGPRWVGDAMNAVSSIDDPNVPWHRVINAKGSISLPEGSRSAFLQRTRLEAEKVDFNSKGLVDFNFVAWGGPDAGWLRERALLTPKPIARKKSADDGGQMKLF